MNGDAKPEKPVRLNDRDIREPLFDFLERRHAKVRFLQEIEIDKTRADVLMVLEDSLVGLEIKSDADTFARLPQQIPCYDRYFDRNYIVIGVSHLGSVKERVPAHWGIITAEIFRGEYEFCMLRDAVPNPKLRINTRLMLLWKSELAHLQEFYGLPAYKQKSKAFIRKKLRALHLERDPFCRLVSNELFERDYSAFDSKNN